MNRLMLVLLPFRLMERSSPLRKHRARHSLAQTTYAADVVSELVGLINRAYAVGEAGLWLEGVDRTDEAEIAAALRAGQMLVRRDGDRIVGCLRTRALDAAMWEVGLIGVAPDAWGGGVGRELIEAAEARARAGGGVVMQLELLVPRTGTHPVKERLREWYTRRGYTVVRRVPMEEYLPEVARLLSAPGDILIFTKRL
jgi:GNAT superfamily N-acetyltransferase